MELKEDPYPEEKINEDMDYVLDKLGLTKGEFEEIFSRPPKTFLDYPTTYPIIKKLRVPLKLVYKLISSAPPTIFDEMEYFEEDMKRLRGERK
jgi:hypothetical protein